MAINRNRGVKSALGGMWLQSSMKRSLKTGPCSRFLNRRKGGPVEHHKWWVSTHQLKNLDDQLTAKKSVV